MKTFLLFITTILLLFTGCQIPVGPNYEEDNGNNNNVALTSNVSISSLPDNAEIWIKPDASHQMEYSSINTPFVFENISTPFDWTVILKKEGYKDTTFCIDGQMLGITYSCNIILTPISSILTGNIFVTSVPSGAQILLNETITSYITPNTLENITVGIKNITLKLSEYKDTTFTINVISGETVNSPLILMTEIPPPPPQDTTNYLETLILDFTIEGSIVSTNLYTNPNKIYKIKVSGNFSLGYGWDNDGAYQRTMANGQWLDYVPSMLRWTINNVGNTCPPTMFPNPAQFNPNRIYYYYIQGDGNKIVFANVDEATWDNSGSLTFKIAEL